MDTQERFAAGDRNSGNGPLPGQQEASIDVFEDGQIRDTTAPVKPLKDEESFVYGDSRPDETAPKDDFVDISDGPMTNTTREDLPEVRTLSPEELAATSHGQGEEIRPLYNPVDGSEGQILVEKEATR